MAVDHFPSSFSQLSEGLKQHMTDLPTIFLTGRGPLFINYLNGLNIEEN
jgi:hypothetical protein